MLVLPVQSLCTAVQSDNQEETDSETQIGDLVEGKRSFRNTRGGGVVGWGWNWNVRSHFTYLFGRLYGQTDADTALHRTVAGHWADQNGSAVVRLLTISMSLPCVSVVISAMLFSVLV